MVPNSDPQSPPLSVLHQFSYDAYLPPNSPQLRWSRCNRLIGLNLATKLIVFQVNINYGLTGSTVNRKQSNEEALKFTSTIIAPSETVTTFQVGKFVSTESSLCKEFGLRPKKLAPRFNSFAFSPSNGRRRYNLIGTISDDYGFVLYIQLNSQQWHLLHNLSTDLNRHYTEHEWKGENNDNKELNFDSYKQRLETLWTTCFCWDSQCNLSDKSVEFRIYSASKNGFVYFWRIILSQDENCQMPKCETEIDQIVESKLTDIVTIQYFYGILLVESADGQSIALSTNNVNHRIDLWTEQDNLPCYNFAFSRESKMSTSIQIVFHKVNSIISAQITDDFMLEGQITQHPLEEDIELLSVQSYDEAGQYWATGYNSSKIWQFSFNKGKLSRLEQIKVDFIFDPKSSIDALAFSANQAMIAFVSANATFSAKSHVAKNVELLFCTRNSSERVCDFLQQKLPLAFSSVEMKSNTLLNNIDDYLYLFRYYLYGYTEKRSSAFGQLLQQLLNKCGKLKITGKDTEAILRRYRLVHFLAKRYLEMLNFFPHVSSHQGDEEQRGKFQIQVKRLIECSEQHILEGTIRQALDRLGKSALTSLNYEQLVSLSNITHSAHQQHCILHKAAIPKPILDQVERLVHDKTPPSNYSSLRGPEFKLPKTSKKSLLEHLNKCPFCEATVHQPIGNECGSHQHQLDVCANSHLIADHLTFDLDLCSGCGEAKLLAPRIWPCTRMSPFNTVYDLCFFCL